MRTSDEGIQFLERHEGVVLKAYRDPVGILTIGAGLTKASGVVDPKPGMVISNAEASTLLQRALKANYEPSVRDAMPAATQQEFDAGVSFHWNTGAIRKASWVKAWKARNWGETKTRLLRWSKAKGKVLPGLARRRREEFAVMRYGSYGRPPAPKTLPEFAQIVVPYSGTELGRLRDAFGRLKYDPGPNPAGVLRTAVIKFQRDHDLTVDGKIGPATLSTIQRRLDARNKGRNAAVANAATAGSTQTPETTPVEGWPEISVLGWLALGLTIVWAFWLAWRYRDVLAAKLQRHSPSLAAFLRSF